MGMSASAEIFFGYDLANMEDENWNSLRPQWWEDEDYHEWPKALAGKLGWVEVPYPDFGDEHNARYIAAGYDVRERMYRERLETPEYRVWAANRDEMRQVIENAGLLSIELDSYGYLDGEPSFALKVTESVKHAWDYGCVELPPKLAVFHDWRDQLHRVAELLELGDLGEPAWHMAVTYG